MKNRASDIEAARKVVFRVIVTSSKDEAAARGNILGNAVLGIAKLGYCGWEPSRNL